MLEGVGIGHPLSRNAQLPQLRFSLGSRGRRLVVIIPTCWEDTLIGSTVWVLELIFRKTRLLGENTVP